MNFQNNNNKNKKILYTGLGDKGKTTLFDCKQYCISKNANLIEALGEIDELNAYLGIVKTYATIEQVKLKIGRKNILFSYLIGEIQQILFIIQAELAGSKIVVKKKNINRMELIIEKISEILPPITSFTISGGSLLSSQLDYSRTLARRAERRIISVVEERNRIISENTLSYFNRLSSFLFALSRYTNYFFSIKEDHPNYNK